MERNSDRDAAARPDGRAADAAETPAKKKPVRLDLEKLDLSVEEVEERIRPGETNVFDK